MPKMPQCTAQLKGGEFCSAPSMEDMQFPICFRHASQVWVQFGQHFKKEIAAVRARGLGISEGELILQELAFERWRKADRLLNQVVYYIDFGDCIKIGWTSNLKARSVALMRERNHILAAEPGSRADERARHAQFAEERIGKRELFRKSDRLMGHIEDVACVWAGVMDEYDQRHAS